MLKASGCMNSTSMEALEILTNTPPIDLQLKQRQAQERIRISAKHEEDHLKADFNSWLDNAHTTGRKPTLFHLLMSRFREISDKIDIVLNEKEFQYTKDLMCLMTVKGKTDYRDGFRNSKEVQELKIRDKLRQIKDNDIVVFTDGSALSNPGPISGRAVIYIGGYGTNLILLKKGVIPISNNYIGEIIGVQIALEFLTDLNTVLRNRTIHFLWTVKLQLF